MDLSIYVLSEKWSKLLMKFSDGWLSLIFKFVFSAVTYLDLFVELLINDLIYLHKSLNEQIGVFRFHPSK